MPMWPRRGFRAAASLDTKAAYPTSVVEVLVPALTGKPSIGSP